MYSKIYLIDDVELVNLMHLMMLKKLGLEDMVVSFTNPVKALNHLRIHEKGENPILVLLDINMPEINGFQFLECMVLEKFTTNIDVVIVTSSINNKDKAIAKTFPQYIMDFVTKPLKIEKIEELLQNPIKRAL